jgi:WD40 repeat protein
MRRPLGLAALAVLGTLAVPAAAQDRRGACPADGLRREKIAARDLAEAGHGNPDDAPPELVAVRPSAGEQRGYTCAAFSPDGKLLLLGAEDGRVTAWDLARNKASDVPAHKGRVWDVQVGPNRKTYATAGADGAVRVSPLSGAGAPLTLQEPGADFCTLAYGPDGKLLAVSSSGSRGGILRLHNLTNPAREVPLKGRDVQLSATAISPDGKILAAGTRGKAENPVRLWDTKTGAQTRALEEAGLPAHTLAFRPDGSLLASAHDRRNFVRLWDPDTGQKVRKLVGHTAAVAWLAFSPQGDVLATAGADRTVRLWDPDTGKERAVIVLGPKGGLTRLA